MNAAMILKMHFNSGEVNAWHLRPNEIQWVHQMLPGYFGRGSWNDDTASPLLPSTSQRGGQNLHMIREKLNVGECLTKDPQKQAGPGTAGLPVDLLHGP